MLPSTAASYPRSATVEPWDISAFLRPRLSIEHVSSRWNCLCRKVNKNSQCGIRDYLKKRRFILNTYLRTVSCFMCTRPKLDKQVLVKYTLLYSLSKLHWHACCVCHFLSYFNSKHSSINGALSCLMSTWKKEVNSTNGTYIDES